MTDGKWIKPEEAKHWIALDGDGQAQGRFHSTSAMSQPVVLGLMRSLLPEVTKLQLISWNRATTDQRLEAAQYKPFTPLTCVKLGIRSLPEPPPAPPPPRPAIQVIEGLPPHHRAPSTVERWAGKLQKRFAQAGGGQ